MSAGLLKMLEISREDVGELRTKLIETTKQRDAWRAACRFLYDAVQEGSAKGRPMDLIGKAEWHRAVYLIGHADELESPDGVE